MGAVRKGTIRMMVTGRPRLADPCVLIRSDGGIAIGHNLSAEQADSKPLGRSLPVPDEITAALDLVVGLRAS